MARGVSLHPDTATGARESLGARAAYRPFSRIEHHALLHEAVPALLPHRVLRLLGAALAASPRLPAARSELLLLRDLEQMAGLCRLLLDGPRLPRRPRHGRQQFAALAQGPASAERR